MEPEPRRRFGRRRDRRPWSVGAHLLAIVLVVCAVFGGLGWLSATRTLRDARRDARAAARFQAGIAADAVGQSIALAQGQVASVVTNPALAPVFANPAGCTLSFSLDIFPRGHLDLVTPDGRVICSSLALDAAAPDAASHAGAAWLGRPRGEMLQPSAVFEDHLTGERAVALAAPVRNDAGQELGLAAVIGPVDGMASALARSYGGPQGFRFVVSDRNGDALSGTALRGATASGRSLVGTRPVGGLGWQVTAIEDAHVALAPTRAVLVREGQLAAAALALVLLLLAVVHRRIARPLRRLTRTVAGASAHAEPVMTEPAGPSEIVSLTEEFNRLTAARHAYESQLAHQMLHDPLTRLPNRALLTDRVSQALADAARSGATVGVFFIDIDRFKLVNDGLGHSAGDEVLVTLATRLTDVLSPGESLARFGGDSFVAVCPDIVGPVEASTFAERLVEAVAMPSEAADQIVTVTASIGVALSSRASTHEDLMRDADAALHSAKQRGGGNHELFHEAMRARAADRLLLDTELRVAVDRRELYLLYQPKVDLVSGAVIGVEALLRWRHESLGDVSPVSFIPVAEESGLIVPIGQFVLEEACAQAAAWRDQGIDLTVSINLSGRQLSAPTLVDDVATVLEQTQMDRDRICIELTESVLMVDAERTTETLTDLHRSGVQLSIDDFGTGYSSLAYLQRFPVDELKIDRSFISALTATSGSHTLIEAIIAMGRALGLRIVAEGVETVDQDERLRRLGCDEAQGYLYARPQRADAITERLRPLVTDAR